MIYGNNASSFEYSVKLSCVLSAHFNQVEKKDWRCSISWKKCECILCSESFLPKYVHDKHMDSQYPIPSEGDETPYTPPSDGRRRGHIVLFSRHGRRRGRRGHQSSAFSWFFRYWRSGSRVLGPGHKCPTCAKWDLKAWGRRTLFRYKWLHFRYKQDALLTI